MPSCRICDRKLVDDAAECPGCGAPTVHLGRPIDESRLPSGDPTRVDPATAALQQQLVPLIAAGQLIQAIKQYRAATGASLEVAKHAVEQLRDSGTLPTAATAPLALSPQQEQALLELLRASKPLDAIRAYREQAGCDLKSSRQVVEALARKHAIPFKAGCGAAVLVCLLAAGLLWITAAAVASDRW